jgi:methyl-accepting chemotaxis protein
MQWFKNFRTSVKILLLVLLMIVLMLVISITGYRTSGSIAASMNEMYDNYVMPAIWVSEAKALAIQSRRLVLSLINAEEKAEKDSYEQRIEENRKEASDLLSKYEQTNLTALERQYLSDLYSIRDKVAKLRAQAMEWGRDPSRAHELNELMRSGGEISNAEAEYIAAFEKLVDLLIKMCEDTNVHSQSAARSGTMQIAVSSIVALLLGLAFGVLISKLITGPIAKIQTSVESFADGDLVSKFPAVGRDELAVMGRGLQSMADNLREIIGSVKEASGNITETAQEFSALAEETNAAVEEFRANVDEMGSNLNTLASTGEEVNASVEEVAAGAQATAEKGTDIARQVDDAMSAGESGMSAVQRAVNGIDGVVKNANEAAQSVQELGARTRQIQSFVAQIGGIADQTNLLALNAAIEAARAGEAGRGFAVVAEEVRKLAEDSNAAAKNIEELAKTITGDLDRVVNISLDNAKASQGAMDLSRETEAIISSMISYLKAISGATQDLAAVSQEQAASSEEIAEAVQNIATRVASTAEAGENIRAGVGEVATAAERMAKGAESLSGLASNLQDMLLFFKMDEDAVGKKPRESRLRALPGNKR